MDSEIEISQIEDAVQEEDVSEIEVAIHKEQISTDSTFETGGQKEYEREYSVIPEPEDIIKPEDTFFEAKQLEKTGQYAKAFEAYIRVLTISPETKEAKDGLKDLVIKTGDLLLTFFTRGKDAFRKYVA